MSVSRLCLPTIVLLAGACAGDPAAMGGLGSGDPTAAESTLRFLRPAGSAPPLAERSVSFWAVRGQRRELRLMYRPAQGQPDSVEFARFRVDDRSLVNDVSGQPLPMGDSIRITLTVADTLRLITEFEPSGLRFNPARPARLWLKFGEADPDLDGDGLVTAADTTLLLGMSIWRQEAGANDWTWLPSSIDTSTQEVEADIAGFTRFAVSY